MAIEIEKRFLVDGEDWKKVAKRNFHFRQGYLSTNQSTWTIRIRIKDTRQAWLTLKKPIDNFMQHEFEYSIPLDEAEAIWTLIKNKITKTRFELTLNNQEWIVDCFEGANSPLIIAEIELQSTQVSVIKPSWCWKEITGDYQWSNAALAHCPIQEWSSKKRIDNKLE